MSDLAPDLEYDEEEAVDPQEEQSRLLDFANAEGDISSLLDDAELGALGLKVVQDWQRDKGSNQKWRDATEAAIKSAAQDNGDEKTFPWNQASNINFPLQTVAAQQFAARAYPAIVKGDQAVGVKVIGDKPKKPVLPENLPEQLPPEAQQAIAEVMQGYQQAQQAWEAKQSRAERVKTWMNYHLFYGLPNWEESVDTLLNLLPIVGMGFKKVYFDPHRGVCSDFVNALHLTVPAETEDLSRCPRVTQDYELYPYEIHARQATGVFREVSLIQDSDDEQAPRLILEQHRLDDLDGDGIEEPYVVTVDEQSNAVLRIEAAFSEEDIAYAKEGGGVTHIRRWMPFIAFPFMPDPEGNFYGIGFGQLLAPLNAVINSTINQLMDAATAAAAGGGFLNSGLRLQGAGQTTTLRFQPGEFKYVSSNGKIQDAIWERTVPQPSPVSFQLLELVLGAAKDVASIKDVLSGEAPATAPVGTTLALIEQGLQSFSAIFKRVYRSLKAEYRAIYECQRKWGSPEEYREILDDPEADLEQDFSLRGEDIVPVADPSVVTKAQELAKAQVIQQTAAAFPNVMNPAEAIKRILEAANIDEDGLLPEPQPPPPQVIAELEKTQSETEKNRAQAANYDADAAVKTGQAQMEGALNAAYGLGFQGGVPGVEGAPDNPMGGGGPVPNGGPPEGGMAPGLMGAGQA